jgi:para-nitrobenzyl esterase
MSMKLQAYRNPLTLLAVMLCAVQPSLAQIQTVKVTGGTVRGVVQDRIASFKGIPFAAPPVGDLRWKAPQPVRPWTGVKQADAFGPWAMQGTMSVEELKDDSAKVSEDCLYLNVWTGAKDANGKLPVMVWIHGGGFIAGMTSIPYCDGTRLAQKGVVLVSIAYRLGVFGFLAHPELSRESGQGSGCYGIQDQVASLQWVKDNIVQFGGDPSRVTIFGESAGGRSVSMLTTVPAAKGLFQRAISQSGGSMAPIKQSHDNAAGMLIPSLRLAEETGKNFMSKLGASDLRSARALSAEHIQKAAVDVSGFRPVADGTTLIGDPYELYEAGQFNDTPVLIGTNSDEGAMFVSPPVTSAAFEQQIRGDYGTAAEAILEVYAHATDAEAFKAAKDVFRDWCYAWPTWVWAKLQSQKGQHKAFVYYFDYAPPGSDGANHGAEIIPVFRNMHVLKSFGYTPTPKDIAGAEMISSYWVNFARSGNPNGPGLPAWPAFTEQGTETMVFDQTSSARSLPNLDKLKAIDGYFAWCRAQAKAGPK